MDVTEPNENEYTCGGVRYVAEDEPTGSCIGCAFQQTTPACLFAPECAAQFRIDNRNIIWVVAK